MKSLLKAFTVVGASTLAILACDGPLFYAELEEPMLCTTMQDVPFEATSPGQDLNYTIPIPIGVLPLFNTGSGDGGNDGGPDFETEIRLVELRLVAEQGIPDFNAIETASVSVLPPEGSSDAGLPAQELLSYTKDPNDLPGTTLVVAGAREINLVPYLYDATGSDAGIPIDAGSGMEQSVQVQGLMTGVLPDNPWSADVRVCVYMRTRFNYLNAYGF